MGRISLKDGKLQLSISGSNVVLVPRTPTTFEPKERHRNRVRLYGARLCFDNDRECRRPFTIHLHGNLYLAKEFITPPPKAASILTTAAVTLTEQELNNKVGAYWDSKLEEIGRISLKDGKLQLSISGSNVTLVPMNANRFRAERAPIEAVFESSTQGAASKLTVNVEGRAPLIFAAVPPAETSKLSEFEGMYYSEEIDSTYRITVNDGKLVVTRKKAGPIPLTPAFRDAFSSLSILGTFRFTRDAQHRVNGFRLSAGRIRNFRFVKQ